MQDGNEQNGELLNSDDFVNQVNGTGEAPDANVQMPDKIGEIPTTDFLQSVNGYTEGKIQSLDDFQQLLGYKNKHTELQQKYEQLETQSQISPFHSDFSSEINRLLKDGASQEEVVQFVKLQSMDVEAMEDKNSIILAKKLALNGKLSDAQLEDWYSQTYGNPKQDDDEDPVPLSGAQQVAIIEAARAAKGSLNQMKVDSGEPASVANQRKMEQQFQTNHEWWNNVVGKTIASEQSRNLSFDLGGKNEDGTPKSMDLDFPIPKDFQNLVHEQASLWAAKNGLKSTEADYAKVKDFSDRLFWGFLGPQVAEAIARNTHAKTTKTVTQAQHNINPIGEQKVQKNVDPQAAQTLAAKIRGMKPFG
jgi:hypothetical protein